MGNTNGHQNFVREESRRYSLSRRHRSKKKVPENGDEFINSLIKSMTKHKDCLESNDKAINMANEMRDFILGLSVSELKAYDKSNAEKEIKISENKFREITDRIKHLLQTLGHSQERLKDSFKEICNDISETLAFFHVDWKAMESDQDPNPNQEFEQLEYKLRFLRDKMYPHTKSETSPVTVQLFYTQEGQTIKDIEKELKTLLESKMESKVNFIHLSDTSEINDTLLMIVVCIVSTRLGSDASQAIKHIKNTENAVLLIVHRNEPQIVLNSTPHLTGKEFQNLRGIFDMSFITENGTFRGHMSPRNTTELCLLCKQFSVKDTNGITQVLV